jgi:hypothetical protein
MNERAWSILLGLSALFALSGCGGAGGSYSVPSSQGVKDIARQLAIQHGILDDGTSTLTIAEYQPVGSKDTRGDTRGRLDLF